MKKIITAINNPIINEKLKKEKIEVIGKDIQYKEGILEILENNKEINFILIDEKLPGEIKNDELINKIKKINKNIEIIFFIKKENKKNAIINEKKIIKDEKIKSKIKIVDYEKEIKIESFLNFILYGEEILGKEYEENYTNRIDIINEKIEKYDKNQNIIISVNGDSAVGKKMTTLRLSLYLNKYNNKILIIDLNTKSHKTLSTIFNKKENSKTLKKNNIKKIKNIVNNLKNQNLKYENKKIGNKIILKNKIIMKNAKYSINANLVYKNGYSGKNVNIAVLDTGVFKHKQLDGCIKHFMDFVGGKETCYDDNGHGTHVCGILSAADIGMAPGAGLYVFKVLDYLGMGQTADSIRALKYIKENCVRLNIKILNFSVGYLPCSDTEDRIFGDAHGSAPSVRGTCEGRDAVPHMQCPRNGSAPVQNDPSF